MEPINYGNYITRTSICNGCTCTTYLKRNFRVPLWKALKSDFADLKNLTSPGVGAGTITAGIFLSEFVGDTNWAHLDIAGTAWNNAAKGYVSKGGSGYGVDLLATACQNLEKL